MAEHPESMEKIRQEATVAMNAGKQLKTKFLALSKIQEADEGHVWFEDRWMVASLCDE
jgi:hypothetical protein